MADRALTCCIAVVGVLALISFARRAAADEPRTGSSTRVRFAWVRGDDAGGCLDERRIEAGVAARLGRDPFADDAALSIEGSVEHSGSVWRADVRVRDEHGALLGRRTLDTDAADCGPLGEAVILAVALVVDPNAAARSPPAVTVAPAPAVPPPQTASAAAPCPAAPPCPIATPCPACAKPERSEDGVDVLAGMVGSAGILPRAAVGPVLWGSYGHGPFELTAALWWLPEVSTNDDRFAFGFVAGSAGPCYRARLGVDTELAGCAELDLGSLHAVVRDVRELTPLDPGEQLIFAAGVGPRLSFSPGALRIEAGFTALALVRGKTFRIQGVDSPVAETSPVAGVVFLGLGFGVP